MIRPDGIQLTERTTRSLPADRISEESGRELITRWSSYLNVEPPSVLDERWNISASNWVGAIPVSGLGAVYIAPKVPVASVVAMLEYAYDLPSFTVLKDAAPLATVDDLLSRLARILAHRVIQRAHRGLHQEYLTRKQVLPKLRGRLQVSRHVRAPWRVSLPCEFHDLSADLADNQIPAWTLLTVARSSLCRPSARQDVRRAMRLLDGRVTPVPCTADDCIDRTYQRLNADYEPIHALCRLILEAAGPAESHGDRAIVPFLVNMDDLFERFFAAWLAEHAPPGTVVEAHLTIPFGAGGQRFDIDVVMRDAVDGRPVAVLDTKYKDTSSPSSSDVQQIVAYAESLGVDEAVLVYPSPLASPLDDRIGESPIRVRTLAFDLERPIEEAGRPILEALRQTAWKPHPVSAGGAVA